MSHSADTPLGMPAPWLDGKKIVVTGGTGFVGRHLLPQLLAAGARVTCITRATSRRDHLPAGVEVVRADLRSGAGLEEALRGQDICIHMAALLFGLGWQDYLRANSEAARALATAWQRLDAQGQAPQRMVLVSSLAASGPCDTAAGRGDDAPVSAYGWSKLMVEQILGRALGDRMVTLRPRPAARVPGPALRRGRHARHVPPLPCLGRARSRRGPRHRLLLPPRGARRLSRQ